MSIINKNFAELDNEGTTKLYSDKSGVPNISIGIQADGTSRIRVAKEGFDVTKATDAQLSFNSAQNTLKVVATGSVDLLINLPVRNGLLELQTDFSTFGVTHNLGYVPTLLVFFGNTNGAGVVTDYFPVSQGSIIQNEYAKYTSTVYKMNASVDITSLTLGIVRHFWIDTAASTSNFVGTIRVKYLLLQESIQ